MKLIRKRSRYRQIAAVFAKYGFADLVSELGFSRFLPKGRILPRTPAERMDLRGYNLKLALQELGPTFIKIGQFFSTRPDLLPEPVIEHLEKLLDEVPPGDFDEAVKVIETELGGPLKMFYKRFSTVPIASASLAQVYEAVTTEGDIVAVKVQRPGISETIEADIGIIKQVADILATRTKYARSYDFRGLAREFEWGIREEIDFRTEATNIEIISNNLRRFTHIKLPKVYKKYSRHRVLTLEKIEGFRITDKKKLNKLDKQTRQELANQLLQSYLKQILEDGFFHADPHPGNIFILPEGKIALIDMGIVGKLDSDIRGYITKLLLSFVQQETVQISDTVTRMSTSDVSPEQNKLRKDIGRIVTKYYNRPAEEINIGEAVIELIRIVSYHNLMMPSSLGLFGKTMLYIDRICRYLSPDINYSKFINRSSQNLLIERTRSQFTLPKITRNLLDINEFMFDFPSKVHTLLQKFSEDNLNIKFQHVGLEELERTLDSVANRLAFAMIVAALIIGSALVMRIPVGPFLFGYPVLGVLGFVFASILGISLLFSIIRSKGRL